MDQTPIPGRAYVVGGAVRDALLGRPVHDRDWVAVGATAQQMVDAGFRPVGRDFPVFLHPVSGAEYALAPTTTQSRSCTGRPSSASRTAPPTT